jgi:hypothetical protein
MGNFHSQCNSLGLIKLKMSDLPINLSKVGPLQVRFSPSSANLFLPSDNEQSLKPSTFDDDYWLDDQNHH